MTRTAVVAYIRVSTEHQAESGVSLAAQRAKLEAYALALDLDLVAVEVDAGLSAKSLNRPGLQSALARLQAGEATGLLVTKLDRLTRSVKDLGTLVERYFGERYSLLSVADSIDTRTAGGRLVLNVLASVSQWEREAIAERTREALQHKKARGERVGTLPYGYRLAADGVHLEPEEYEQDVMATVRLARVNGLTWRAIVDELCSAGIMSRKGRPLGLRQVHAMGKAA